MKAYSFKWEINENNRGIYISHKSNCKILITELRKEYS